VAEAEQRPGTGMYGGNLELVSRRENVQVNALKEYYEEHDGGGQQMLRFQFSKSVQSILKYQNLRMTIIYI